MVTNPRLLPVRNAREQMAVAGRSSVLVTCNPQTRVCYVSGKGGECVMERDEWDHYRNVLCAPLERRAWVVGSLIVETMPSFIKFEIENAPEGTECPVFGRPQVYLDRQPGYFRILNLFVPVACRRAGMATRLMREILSLTGMSKLPVYVDAVPFGGEAMTQEELFGFYRPLGFERVPGHDYAMVRRAGVVAQANDEDPLAGGEKLPIGRTDVAAILMSMEVALGQAQERVQSAQGNLSVTDYGDALAGAESRLGVVIKCLQNLAERLSSSLPQNAEGQAGCEAAKGMPTVLDGKEAA